MSGSVGASMGGHGGVISGAPKKKSIKDIFKSPQKSSSTGKTSVKDWIGKNKGK
jgi:hypothetical protein